MQRRWFATLLVALLTVSGVLRAEDKPLRIGIVGLDTSHVIAFTSVFNDSKRKDHVPGARVVAAFKGGSPDVESSATRIDRFTKELVEKWGVELVDDIPTLCTKVDAVLLESVDGRSHLEQLRPILAAKKPVFIDKPLSGSIEDAKEIARLVKESGVPCFSSSSLRFFGSIAELRNNPDVGDILGCEAYSPCSTEPHHPDLYWYGVHGVEILFTLMGPGCVEVTRTSSKDFDVVVGRWSDGRIGTYRGIRKGKRTYGATVFGSKGIRTSVPIKGSVYRPMLVEIVSFFRSGKPPVSMDETLEMFAFMSAADVSKKRGGAPVRLAEVLGSTRVKK
jgi:predicted dehydrogenase